MGFERMEPGDDIVVDAEGWYRTLGEVAWMREFAK
jgi:hypothetical protein